MLNLIPGGPWDNPIIDDGVYEATVVKIVEETYGPDDSPMLKLIFHLPSKRVHFVTHLYFPQGASVLSERRLWHFCGCVGLEKYDITSQSETFTGRRLRLAIHTVQPSQSTQDHPYSDVRLFLPAESGDTNISSASAADSPPPQSCGM